MKVLKFGAVWCNGCLVMRPRWQEIEKETPWLTTKYFDFDKDKEMVLEALFFQDIPINDYDTAGNPQRGLLQVREIINDLEIDGGEESGIRQWNILFGGRLTEKWS